MTKRTLLAGVICVGVLSVVSTVEADPITIDFSTGSAGAGGTICFGSIGTGCAAGTGTGIGTGTLAGRNIRIGVLDGHIVTGNGGLLYGSLDFQSGFYEGYFDDAYHFGAGGYFTIHGNVLDAGINCPSVVGPECADTHPIPGGSAGALLLNGVFGAVTITKGAGNQSFVNANGSNTVNDKLEAFFGLDSDSSWLFSLFTIELGSGSLPMGQAFNATAFSVNVSDQVVPDVSEQAVPEPASLLLLGSGCTILGNMIRRRRAKRAA